MKQKSLALPPKILIFLVAITIVNFLQAYFTEITQDESYYFQYAKHLDWGYYDHPPMVALVIWISQLFFDGNLGVRFISILMFSGNIWLVWQYLLPKNLYKLQNEFIIISSGLVMFNAYSFITTPDVPLLFFTTVFFIFYKNFCHQKSFLNSIFLGISIALLLYSKYQGVLLVFFVLLSNYKLLTKGYFYLAAMLAALLMIPHLLWHIRYEFPTLQFHLIDRSSPFEIIYLLEYFPNQMAVFNPFILIPFIILLFRNTFKDLQEKAYYFVSIGFLIFFLLTSFRGHVEPHWTVLISVPILLLLLSFVENNSFWRNYIQKYVLSSLVLVLIARILLLTPLLPKQTAFYGKKEQYNSILKHTGKSPVLFTGSFQDPSLYNYFTGIESSTLGSLNSKKTQFDIWKSEQNYFGKKVFVEKYIPGKSFPIFDQNHQVIFHGFWVEKFQTPNRLKIKYSITSDTLKNHQVIPICIYNPTKNTVDFNHPEIPVRITATFLNHRETTYIPTEIKNIPNKILPGQKFYTYIKINTLGIKKGTYNFGITTDCILGNAYNSNFMKVIVP